MSYGLIAAVNIIGSPAEGEGSLFEPETILPEQFLVQVRSRATAERLLLLALLQDAISCFQKFLFAARARNRRLFREAEQWILEGAHRRQGEDTHPYFSFEQTCCFLGIDPDYVRDKLLRWQQRQLAQVCQPVADSSGALASSQRRPTSAPQRDERPALVSRGPVSVIPATQRKRLGAVPARRVRQRLAC